MIRRIKDWLFHRKIRRAVVVLIGIDRTMKKMGWPQWKRKQFWRDFVKSNRRREAIFSEIMNQK